MLAAVNILTLLGGAALIIAFFLLLILYFRMQAFIALLLTAIAVGLAFGMPVSSLIDAIKSGIGNPGMGGLIIVIGLGGIFGAILEQSGGANSIAQFLLSKLGVKNAPFAMMITGFVVAIPVFFDVAFIILIPVVFALQKQTGKSILLYAIPLLAGLAITHTFIPPTPGPILVAEALGVDLGWVIMTGFIVGLPTALISGLWFGKRISEKIYLEIPEEHKKEVAAKANVSFSEVAIIILVPIVLILLKTLLKSGMIAVNAKLIPVFTLLGEPFVALIIANLLAWYMLGIRKGMAKNQLLKISTKSLGTVGAIILVTGAGAVLKQVLIKSGVGESLAQVMVDYKIPIILFAFLSAALVRVLQGSATVAMVTAASLVAVVCPPGYSSFQLSLLVIAVASGASVFSHVNDSGFWLVSQYLGMSEKQTFRSWTMMTTLFGFIGFCIAALLWGVA